MEIETKRIQMNSAGQAYDQATAAYISALPADQRAEARRETVTTKMAPSLSEAEQLIAMDSFLLKLLNRETGSGGALSSLTDVAESEAARIQAEIDSLKTQIRTERRIFLDSSPSVSPAVGGLYFTRTPDNQVLIAFLSCFGGFLLFAGLLVLMGHVQLTYFDRMNMTERVQVTLVGWGVGLAMMYIGFFVFT